VLHTTVSRFRLIALIEGISFLILLLIAMPIKYVDALGQNPEPVKYVGWVHGILFILYGIAGFAARSARGWPWSEAIRAFVAGIIPCGTFYYDAKFLRPEQAKEKVERDALGISSGPGIPAPRE
jgi:integral membrane protein